MSNIKLYSLTPESFAIIKGEKYPKQALQLYKVLAESGKGMRGIDIVALAIKNEGLVTRQEYAVLAAWYFSSKRRPSEIKIGEPILIVPIIEDMTDEENIPTIENLAA